MLRTYIWEIAPESHLYTSILQFTYRLTSYYQPQVVLCKSLIFRHLCNSCHWFACSFISFSMGTRLHVHFYFHSTFNFFQILRDFLKAKIDQNASPQSVAQDDNKKIHRLVSSVAIAHVLVSHKVRLDPEDYAKLFSSLILWQDANEKNCTALRCLVGHFPSKELQ